MFNAYLEDFYDIKIIIKNSHSFNDKIYLEQGNTIELLSIVNIDYVYQDIHLYCKTKEIIKPYLDYFIRIEGNEKIPLRLGKITRSSIFDRLYYFDGWLGYKYSTDKTIFRVWSPVCKEIKVVVDDIEHQLKYIDRGVWETTLLGDFEKSKYYYLFRINDDFNKTLDPYANSSGANHEFNYIVDLSKTYKLKKDYYKAHDNCKIIYELSIRDATSKVDCKNKGSYDALTASVNTDYGLGYIKNLGITHLQLMPIFAFGGVNEDIQDSDVSNFKYNWGYNPMQYNVPSGFFSIKPNDPYNRINALKKLIDTIHSLDVGVNMDVVYNHVYDSTWFPFEKLVPGYTFRTDSQGFLTNSSWCGNDLRTDALMIRKYIIDSILFYQEFYKIDGFRFDLMGLIDVDTINIIKEKVQKNNPHAMIYGEGWNMDVNLKYALRANMNNSKKLLGVGFFNDYFRNVLRGSAGYIGFASGKKVNINILERLVKGYYYENGEFNDASQSINYVECHDNYTFVDLLKINLPQVTMSQIQDYVRLSLGMVLLSFGTSFIHAGEALLRTKEGIDNSYDLNDNINGIKWHNEYNVTDTLIDLIFLKKKFKVFNNLSKKEINTRVWTDRRSAVPSFRIIDNDGTIIQMFVCNNYEKYQKYFAPGTTMIFNGERIVSENVQKFEFSKPGVYLFLK